jgi:hypothetical protein
MEDLILHSDFVPLPSRPKPVAQNRASRPGLGSLPSEIILRICQYVAADEEFSHQSFKNGKYTSGIWDPHDQFYPEYTLNSLARTCRAFNSPANEILYKHIKWQNWYPRCLLLARTVLGTALGQLVQSFIYASPPVDYQARAPQKISTDSRHIRESWTAAEIASLKRAATDLRTKYPPERLVERFLNGWSDAMVAIVLSRLPNVHSLDMYYPKVSTCFFRLLRLTADNVSFSSSSSTDGSISHWVPLSKVDSVQIRDEYRGGRQGGSLIGRGTHGVWYHPEDMYWLLQLPSLEELALVNLRFRMRRVSETKTQLSVPKLKSIMLINTDLPEKAFEWLIPDNKQLENFAFSHNERKLDHFAVDLNLSFETLAQLKQVMIKQHRYLRRIHFSGFFHHPSSMWYDLRNSLNSRWPFQSLLDFESLEVLEISREMLLAPPLWSDETSQSTAPPIDWEQFLPKSLKKLIILYAWYWNILEVDTHLSGLLEHVQAYNIRNARLGRKTSLSQVWLETNTRGQVIPCLWTMVELEKYGLVKRFEGSDIELWASDWPVFLPDGLFDSSNLF